MSKTGGSSNDVGVTGGDRSTRSRASSSRKCYACQCQQGPHESYKKRTTVKPSKSNAHVNKPKKVGPDVLPSVARAKSSPQLRPDALKKKLRKPVTVSADNSAALEQETSSSQETEGDVKEIAQTSRTPKIRKVPAIPPSNTTTVKTATPRQIWRKKADPIPRRKPAVSKLKNLDDQFSDEGSYEHHITWDGFDEPEYIIGEACCLCDSDLGSASSEDVNKTEFSTLPVVAMLPCGHAFHVSCLDNHELSDDQGDLICMFCESLM